MQAVNGTHSGHGTSQQASAGTLAGFPRLHRHPMAEREPTGWRGSAPAAQGRRAHHGGLARFAVEQVERPVCGHQVQPALALALRQRGRDQLGACRKRCCR